MNLKTKIYYIILVIAILTFSYSMCSTHELRNSNSIFNTRRNIFCSTPYWILVLTTVFLVMFIYE